jgi:hypothetical protein
MAIHLEFHLAIIILISCQIILHTDGTTTDDFLAEIQEEYVAGKIALYSAC